MPIKATHSILALAGLMIALTITTTTYAQNPVVGINVVNPYSLPIEKQNAMLDDLKADGINVIRASITLDDKGVDFAQRAQQRGIKIEWMIYRFGGYEPRGAPLSSADPEQFRRTFAPILARLEDKGIVLTAFELGNEINLAGYNSDFPRPGEGMQFSLKQLSTDPEAERVAKGFLQYLKVLAVLKDIRDHSKLNSHTPILTAGLAAYEQDEGPMKGSLAANDLISANATLEYLRANGVDKYVDGYAIHVYPPGDNPGDPAAGARRTHGLAKYVMAECRPPGSSDGKPCWITEWGFNNVDKSCPINDDRRALLTQEMMTIARPYVQQRRLAGMFYYAYNEDAPNGVYRCGSLTKGGKLATDEGLLK